MVKANDILSDDEIEQCIKGSSNINLIRNLIEISQDRNRAILDGIKFAAHYSDEVNNNIKAKRGTTEWDDANTTNWEWGKSIATNINGVLYEKWIK